MQETIADTTESLDYFWVCDTEQESQQRLLVADRMFQRLHAKDLIEACSTKVELCCGENWKLLYVVTANFTYRKDKHAELLEFAPSALA